MENKAASEHLVRQNCIKELIHQRRENLQQQLTNGKHSAFNRSRIEAELHILNHRKLLANRVCGIANSTLTCSFLIGDLSLIQKISRRCDHTESTSLNYAILHGVEFVKKAIQLKAKPNEQTEFYLELNPCPEVTKLVNEVKSKKAYSFRDTIPWPHEFDFLGDLFSDSVPC